MWGSALGTRGECSLKLLLGFRTVYHCPFNTMGIEHQVEWVGWVIASYCCSACSDIVGRAKGFHTYVAINSRSIVLRETGGVAA